MYVGVFGPINLADVNVVPHISEDEMLLSPIKIFFINVTFQKIEYIVNYFSLLINNNLTRFLFPFF